MPSLRQGLYDLLDANSIPEPNSGCWIWLRGICGGKNKYGVWKWRGRRWQATHLALKCVGIKIPKGRDVCHHCDVTLCVNPDHLFVGTRKDNMRDAQRKGRLVGYGVREFCKYGHPFSGYNVMVDSKSGKRRCRECSNRRDRERYRQSEARRTRWRPSGKGSTTS
jgi:hypothetical protein